MSLEGNLTSFGLSEIIQLIAVQQKTGMLSVTRQSSSAKIFFREGRIISTRDRRKGAPDPLREYFTRYGIISGSEIARLSELSVRSKLDITDVILSEGLLTEEDLRRHCRSHIQETVYEILTWEQCSYKFVAGPQVTEGVRILAELTVEGLLMESMRWIDEFPLFLEEFPHGTAVIRRKSGAVAPEDLPRHENALLELLAGERAIDDLVSHAKVPRFETYETLRQLKEKDLIEVEDRTPPANEPEKAHPTSKRSRAKRRSNPVPLLAAALVFLGCGAWGARDIVRTHAHRAEGGDTPVLVMSGERENIEEGLRWCLEIYRAKYGRYPEDLSALETAKVGPESFFQQVGRHSFRYHLTPGGYRYILL
jgi:hypothetical protein